MTTLSLSGVKVVDLSRVLAGPVCTMILGDMGADVIKVERPGSGDDTRGYGPPFDANGQSAYFLSANRNKFSLALDLSVAGDAEVLRGLIAGADLVVDNFAPGMLERWGLAPRTLLERHPRLLWCSITGFGADSDRPGYDFVVQAESGWMAITGEPNGAPMKMGVALADVLAGKDAAIALLGALVRRAGGDAAASADERHSYISLRHSATAALVNVAQSALVTGQEPKRWGNAHANLVPYEMFQTSDRPIVIAVGNDAQFLACARALGLDALADDPRFRANAGRVTHRDAVVGAMRERLRTRTAAEWMRRLEEARVPSGLVRSVLDALREVDASALTGIAPSVPGAVRRPPPRLDEHGALIRARGWAAFDA